MNRRCGGWLALALVATVAGAADLPTLLVLGRGKDDQAWLQGGGTITVKHGDVAINCPARDALRIWGSALTVPDGHIGVFGGCSLGFKGRVNPAPEPLPAQVDDPWASLKIEPPAEVIAANLKIERGQRAVLKPGTYPGGIDVGHDAKVTFQPGLFYLKDGSLTIGMGAELDGQGVTLVLGGDQPGVVNSAPWSKTDLSAPTEGDLKGFVLISYGGQGAKQPWHWLKGYTKLSGNVYVPKGALELWTDKPFIATRVVCGFFGIFTKELVLLTGAAPPAPKPAADPAP